MCVFRQLAGRPIDLACPSSEGHKARKTDEKAKHKFMGAALRERAEIFHSEVRSPFFDVSVRSRTRWDKD